jgi:lipid-A-disaccharide synthase
LLGRPRIKVPHFAMVNLIAGRKIVPELVQHDFTAENVVRNLQEILPAGPVRSAMIEDLTMVRLALRGPATPNETAADRAAQAIQQLLPSASLQPSRSNPS